METTTCKKCNRVVYSEHVDGGGYCCFCAPEKKAPAKKSKKLSEIFPEEKAD